MLTARLLVRTDSLGVGMETESMSSSALPPNSPRPKLPPRKLRLTPYSYWMIASINWWAPIIWVAPPGREESDTRRRQWDEMDAALLKSLRENPPDPYAEDLFDHENLRDEYGTGHAEGTTLDCPASSQP
jgi:hypothetical protein